MNTSATLDTCKINTDTSETCGWCDRMANMIVTIPTMSHDEWACSLHFLEYFPYLANRERVSALCPNVSHGCDHTIAVNGDGYGVACVEYANSQGIEWREFNDVSDMVDNVRRPYEN
jgi:hypothetical protein